MMMALTLLTVMLGLGWWLCHAWLPLLAPGVRDGFEDFDLENSRADEDRHGDGKRPVRGMSDMVGTREPAHRSARTVEGD